MQGRAAPDEPGKGLAEHERADDGRHAAQAGDGALQAALLTRIHLAGDDGLRGRPAEPGQGEQRNAEQEQPLAGGKAQGQESTHAEQQCRQHHAPLTKNRHHAAHQHRLHQRAAHADQGQCITDFVRAPLESVIGVEHEGRVQRKLRQRHQEKYRGQCKHLRIASKQAQGAEWIGVAQRKHPTAPIRRQ